LVKADPLLNIVSNWDKLLASGLPEADKDSLRIHSKTGRPLGNEDFLDTVEKITGRKVKPKKPGPKPKN
jgi:putative transposase